MDKIKRNRQKIRKSIERSLKIEGREKKISFSRKGEECLKWVCVEEGG